jgi:hypothetical protein
MTAYPTYVYGLDGQTKLLKTIEERDAHYQTGKWFDSPASAKAGLNQQIKEAQDGLEKAQAVLVDKPKKTKKAK